MGIDEEIEGITIREMGYMMEFAVNFAKFVSGQEEWSAVTFGNGVERGPIGPLKHLAKEAVECHEAYGTPNFKEELADCLFLLNDAVWRSGMSWGELIEVAQAKLEKNKARTWPAPTGGDEPVEHDRSKDGCCGCDGPLGADGGCEPCMDMPSGQGTAEYDAAAPLVVEHGELCFDAPPVESDYEYIRAETSN